LVPVNVFANRTPTETRPNALARALDQTKADGRPFIDLTESNPTRAGFSYPPDLLTPLADARGLRYDPHPLGAMDARRAVADEYRRHGIDVSPDRIVLTASTSDAYSMLFKLLADAGDEVLVPRPSYPLFEHLTRLDAVALANYDLEYRDRWSIDAAQIEHAVTPRTRAVVVVSPNNPTGSFLGASELDALANVCASRNLAIIADEVFADYELEPGARARAGRPAVRRDVLSF
jgi:aspartate/methionine/tyrosine aminotransferase